jgi:RNA polymerase primary sigma factor
MNRHSMTATSEIPAPGRFDATIEAQELVEAAPAEVAEADVDGVVSDRVLADLTSLEAGQRGPQHEGQAAAQGQPAVHCSYVTAARRNQALWTAKNAFVQANLRLVVTIARRFNHGRMPLQDLIQEGNIGLMKAVDRFDHRKGFRFSTYGSWWIRHAISRAIADKGRAVRLPVHMIDAYNKVSAPAASSRPCTAAEPTDAELADRHRRQRRAHPADALVAVENPVSLDQPPLRRLGPDPARRLEDTSTRPRREQMDNEAMGNLREVFDALLADGGRHPAQAHGPRRRAAEMTLKEIGERYSLSRERIRQLQEQALAKLRGEFKRRDLL